jgi:predicted outer membrane repeat protein
LVNLTLSGLIIPPATFKNTALITFGGGVTAWLTSGTFRLNYASSMIRMVGTSSVTLEDTLVQGAAQEYIPIYGHGVVAAEKANVSIKGCSFSGCTDVPRDGLNVALPELLGPCGACVQATGSSTVDISSSHFTHCFGYHSPYAADPETRLRTDGGGCVQVTDAAHVTIAGCLFMNNTAGRGGGVAAFGNSSTHIIESTFTNCRAVSDPVGFGFWPGGGVLVDDTALMSIVGCLFMGNTARNGGAVASQGSSITYITNSNFSQCEAGDLEFNGDGGGVFVTDDAQVNINGCMLLNNTGTRGGCVACTYNATASISSTTFKDCVAVGNSEKASAMGGGGVMVHDTADVSLAGCHLMHNTAATSCGGCVASMGRSKTNISSTTFEQCAARVGGGVDVSSSAHLYISNDCSFLGCNAMRGGCIAAHAESTPTVLSSSLIRCQANVSGGGVDVDDNAQMLIDRCSFLENLCSPGLGGAIAARAGSTSIRHSTFKNCSGGRGGALFVQGGVVNASVSVADTEFSNNSAVSQGGGISANIADIFGYKGMITVVPLTGQCVFKDNYVKGGYGPDVFSDGSVDFTFTKESNINALSPTVVQHRECVAGETRRNDGICQRCDPQKYKLDNSTEGCKDCPKFAHCSGGAVVVPLPGFWHGSRDLGWKQCALDDMIR